MREVIMLQTRHGKAAYNHDYNRIYSAVFADEYEEDKQYNLHDNLVRLWQEGIDYVYVENNTAPLRAGASHARKMR